MSIREKYLTVGIDQYYLQHGNEYTNPHQYSVIECLNMLYNENRHKAVFDFACGDGLVTKWIGNRSYVMGCDAYLHERYMKETNREGLSYSFNDFINFDNTINRTFDLTVISYALDLCDTGIRPMLLYRLALLSNELLVIRPNKHIEHSPYWAVVDKVRVDKSHSVLYKSSIYEDMTN